MPPELAIGRHRERVDTGWRGAALRLAIAWVAFFILTFADWSAMAHQWWNIDTYSHILLIPPIIAWLVWIKRADLARMVPSAWAPALVWLALGLVIWLGGRVLDINLIAQGGTIVIFQGVTLALLGPSIGMLLAFPLAYVFFLVPFGDEIIPALQFVTAEIATQLTIASGVETVVEGIHIDTPAGLFIVAEECSGVKFLIAMVALGVLVAYVCFSTWIRRLWLMLACLVVPIIANGIRAWATIFIAQYVGAEAAGSFDHIVYGWVFFGLVIALVLGVAWRWFEREPEDAGWSTGEIATLPFVARWAGRGPAPNLILGTALLAAGFFAALVRLV